MKILKIIFSIFFLILYSIAFSQIEILKTVPISGASFYPGIKDNKKNTYIGLFASRAINDSVYVDNKFVVKSKGKIHPIYGKSSAYIFLTLDSNYNASKVHQIYGIRDVNGSRLLLASDSCIYFSILAYDSVYINEELIFHGTNRGYFVLLKYNIKRDTLSIIKEIQSEYGLGDGNFKEFNNKLYYSFYFQGKIQIDGLEFTAGLGQADRNLLILNLNRLDYKVEKSYYFEGDDEKTIQDFLFDQNGILYIIGSFWGSSIISNGDTIRNTQTRSYDGFYFKIDSNKNVLANKRIGGPDWQFPDQLFLTQDGVNILGYYNADFIEVDGVKLLNTSNSYNVFSLSMDSDSRLLSLTQLDQKTFILPYNFAQYSQSDLSYLLAGYFFGELNVGNGRILKNPNDKYDAFILLMDANCGPIDGYQISGVEGESASIINNGNGLYTIWGNSESDTTYFVNFDQKYRAGVGQFFMDIRFKSSTRVEELEEGLKNIEIYPNPSNDFVTIKSFDLNKSMEMEILAIDGKNVYQKEIDISADEIIFRWPSELKTGIYFYKFKSKNAMKIIKVIKQ